MKFLIHCLYVDMSELEALYCSNALQTPLYASSADSSVTNNFIQSDNSIIYTINSSGAYENVGSINGNTMNITSSTVNSVILKFCKKGCSYGQESGKTVTIGANTYDTYTISTNCDSYAGSIDRVAISNNTGNLLTVQYTNQYGDSYNCPINNNKTSAFLSTDLSCP